MGILKAVVAEDPANSADKRREWRAGKMARGNANNSVLVRGRRLGVQAWHLRSEMDDISQPKMEKAPSKYRNFSV